MSADNAAMHKWAVLCWQMASGVKADTHKGSLAIHTGAGQLSTALF